MKMFDDDKGRGNIQRALEEIFFCSFYIYLSDYSFEVYKAQPYMTELLESCDNAVDAANAYIKYMVADESKAEMKAFLDMTTICQRMKAVNVLESIDKEKKKQLEQEKEIQMALELQLHAGELLAKTRMLCFKLCKDA